MSLPSFVCDGAPTCGCSSPSPSGRSARSLSSIRCGSTATSCRRWSPSRQPLALVAVPLTFSIICRNIDLSVGSLLALQGMVIGRVSESSWMVVAVLAAVAVAVAIGCSKVLLVAKLGLSAIMATLATFIWARGLTLAINDSRPIAVDGWLVDVANARWAGFTIAAPLVVIVAYVVGQWMLAPHEVRSLHRRHRWWRGRGETLGHRDRPSRRRPVRRHRSRRRRGGRVHGRPARLGVAVHRDGARARCDHRGRHRRHEPHRRLRLGEPHGRRRDVHERPQQRSAQPRAHRRLLPDGSRPGADRRADAADRHAPTGRTSGGVRSVACSPSKERSANEVGRFRRQGRTRHGRGPGNRPPDLSDARRTGLPGGRRRRATGRGRRRHRCRWT